jgi:hypothetical protein
VDFRHFSAEQRDGTRRPSLVSESRMKNSRFMMFVCRCQDAGECDRIHIALSEKAFPEEQRRQKAPWFRRRKL